MVRSLLAFVFALAIAFAYPMTASGQDVSNATSPRTITVSGTGEASAAPDRATVRFAIVSRDMEAQDARQKNAEAARDAMNAVRDLGIDDADIQMESLTLRPRREYNRQTQETEDLGYEATRSIRVEVTDLEQLPTLIARVVDRGANRLGGVQYGLQDRTALRNDALGSAASDARAKAQLLVSALGASLGPVHQVQEQNFSAPQPRFDIRMEASAMKAADGAEPDAFAAGQIEVEAAIQVTFLME